MKLTVYLIKEGELKFTYRRKSKKEAGFVNGQMRFYLNSNYAGFRSQLKTEPESPSFKLREGPNEMRWRFVIDAEFDAKDISFEFTAFSRNINRTSKSRMRLKLRWDARPA